MIIYSAEEYPQMSPAWWALRCGRPSSSEAKKIITAKDAMPSASQKKYAEELVTDLQNQCPAYFTAKERPINRHTAYGRDMEEEACDWFAQSEYCEEFEVRKVGFITTDDGRFGASPDRMLVSKKTGLWVGGMEAKNYGILKHAKYKFKRILPLEAKAQVHHCLAVTSLPFWYWVSYSPDLDCLVVKVFPDEFTEALKVQLEAFWLLLEEVKRKNGVRTVEEQKPDPKVEQAIQAWKTKLAEGPGICTLNTWLEEMKDLPQASKKPIWEAVKNYGATKGWTFDFNAKVWNEPAPAA